MPNHQKKKKIDLYKIIKGRQTGNCSNVFEQRKQRQQQEEHKKIKKNTQQFYSPFCMLLGKTQNPCIMIYPFLLQT